MIKTPCTLVQLSCCAGNCNPDGIKLGAGKDTLKLKIISKSKEANLGFITCGGVGASKLLNATVGGGIT